MTCEFPFGINKDNQIKSNQIKLTSHTLKIWECIIDQRLRYIIKISDHQFGFMLGRSTTDAIYALRQLIEKFCEGQQSLHCVFIDLEKAFDRVPREELWNCLRLKGIPENYVRIIQDMYKDCRTQVRCAGGLSDSFEVKVGVHQGSALSPLIFIIIMDCLTDAVRRETPWDMMFTDDVVLCNKTRSEAEERLESWTKALEIRGMKVSRKKTEYMATGEDTQDKKSIRLSGEEVPRAKEFKYLGSTVQENGGSSREVSKRIQT